VISIHKYYGDTDQPQVVLHIFNRSHWSPCNSTWTKYCESVALKLKHALCCRTYGHNKAEIYGKTPVDKYISLSETREGHSDKCMAQLSMSKDVQSVFISEKKTYTSQM